MMEDSKIIIPWPVFESINAVNQTQQERMQSQLRNVLEHGNVKELIVIPENSQGTRYLSPIKVDGPVNLENLRHLHLGVQCDSIENILSGAQGLRSLFLVLSRQKADGRPATRETQDQTSISLPNLQSLHINVESYDHDLMTKILTSTAIDGLQRIQLDISPEDLSIMKEKMGSQAIDMKKTFLRLNMKPNLDKVGKSNGSAFDVPFVMKRIFVDYSNREFDHTFKRRALLIMFELIVVSSINIS